MTHDLYKPIGVSRTAWTIAENVLNRSYLDEVDMSTAIRNSLQTDIALQVMADRQRIADMVRNADVKVNYSQYHTAGEHVRNVRNALSLVILEEK